MAQVAKATRPPPPEPLQHEGGRFIAAPDLAKWLSATFINEGGALLNPEHAHLQSALIGCLWTNAPNVRQMRRAGATAEMPNFRGSPWQVARQKQQIFEWFGYEPHFVLTFDAVLAAEMDDASFCALCEHELYHCAQALDEFGGPMFRRDGSPVFAMRGHDAEEFIGVVRRYGVGAAADGVSKLVEAAKSHPLITGAKARIACGTCALKVA